MLKKSFVILIFALGLTVGFSASAASGICPTDNGLGVGCNTGIGEYYCLGSCRTGQTQCPSWSGTVCATGLTCPVNCNGADSCGYCNSCASGYTLCGSYPSQTCTANTTAPANCTAYNQCTAVCSACAQGYELSGGICVAATLKLGPDSVGALSHIFQSTNPSLYVLSNGVVGIGTSTPNASLGIAASSGYAILAGQFKIGNVALPTADADAATKGYVDSTISSATSSFAGLPIGTIGQTLRHDGSNWIANSLLYNNGTNIGIGTTTPGERLELSKDSLAANEFFGQKITDVGGNKNVKIGLLRDSGGSTTYTGVWFNQSVPSLTNYSFLSATGAGAIFNAPSNLYFRISNTSVMQVTPNRGVSIGSTYFATDPGMDNVIIQGNVGIGTTSPLAKLSLAPSTGYAILAGNYKIGNVALPTVDADAATKGYVDSTVAAATSSLSSLWGGTVGANIWNLNSGNVGIGTTTPLYPLEVVTSLNNIAKFTTRTSHTIRINNGSIADYYLDTGNPRWEIKSAWVGSDTISGLFNGTATLGTIVGTKDGTSDLYFYTSNGSDYTKRMVINGSGNVGIGTTNPTSKMHFKAGAQSYGFGGIRFEQSPDSSYWDVMPAYNQLYFGFNGATYFQMNVSGFDVANGATIFSRIARSGNSWFNVGNVGIGTTSPIARLEVVPASGYAILAGDYKIGNVALPTADADAATKGYVDSTVSSATGSLVTISEFVGVTATSISGSNGGTAGYAQAHSLCAAAYADSHVCAAFEILNTIKEGGSVPSEDAWIFSGPPGYTALANDCDARTSGTSAAYGAYWQRPMSGYPEGRGLLIQCNNVMRLACCR